MKCICSKCGLEHEGRPAIAYKNPHFYDLLSQSDKDSKTKISDDFCIIRHEDQTDLFIRAVIHQKINDDCQILDYGVWVSLSQKSYEDYLNNYKNECHEATYFGYLSNNLTGYDDTLSIKTNVVLRGKTRPEVIPHNDQPENAFVKDYYEGIDKTTADRRLKALLKE